MNWFFLALIPPALWAISNHIDKYLLTRFFKHTSGGPLILFSTLIGFFVMAFIAIIEPESISIGISNSLYLMLSGVIGAVGLVLYLISLNKDDASVVVPLFQIIPVFNYLFGLIFLKEHLSLEQIGASFLIIFGSIIIVADFQKKKFQLKLNILGLMAAACFFMALNNLLFKVIALDQNYWGAGFWTYAGLGALGTLILIFLPKWRKEFFTLIKENRISILGLNIFNEIINIIGVLIYDFALLLMPMALVSVVGNGLQPFFVMLFGVILTVFFPKFEHEKLNKLIIAQRSFAIIILFAGAYLLNIK